MPKVYLEKNVLDAFKERINFILDEFELICFSVSGGKDSSVMVQLANMIAKDRDRKFDVLFIDLEAQYKSTIDHVNELKRLSQVRDFYHLCLPLNLSNANSIFQPHWKCWDEKCKDKWVREKPVDAIDIHNHPFGDLFVEGEEFETWVVKFPVWLRAKHGKEKFAGVIGIRADESLNRFRAIAFGTAKYKGKCWSNEFKPNCYNFYPMYDWKTQDIWGAVSKYDLMYNKVYEMLYKQGVSIHSQRICQPYGHDQRVSLNQWAKVEPTTWSKVVNRVSGANFGNIYCKTSLLGHNKSQKPEHMSWQEYAVFLLESMGLYSKTLMNHYVRKIKINFTYYRDNFGIRLSDIPDDLTKEERERTKDKYGQIVSICWKRIARCLEKNDYPCRSLSYGLTKPDKEEILILKRQFGDRLGIPTNTKEMRNLKKEIEYV